MSDSIRLTDHFWNDGESLIARLEQLSFSEVAPEVVYNEAAEGLQRVCGGIGCHVIQVSEQKAPGILARCGIAIEFDTEANFSEATMSPLATWKSPTDLVAIQNVAVDTLAISLRLEFPQEASAGRASCELVRAVLRIVSTVYAESRFQQLSQQSKTTSDQAAWFSKLHSGETLQDSFASIAVAISDATQADRVCLFRKTRGRFQLVATSTQSNIDTRAREVRLLEDLANDVTDSEQAYQESTDSQAQSFHTLGEPNQQAAVLLESFSNADQEFAQPFSLIRQSVGQATSQALRRDALLQSQSLWRGFGRHWVQSAFATKSALLALAFLASVCILCFVPYPFTLCVDGKIVPAAQQHVFAPVNATVDEIFVQNGDTVKTGDVLLRLKSAELDLLQQQVEGELLTSRAQLAVAKATRSSSRSHSPQDREAASQQVLSIKIEGLEGQLEIVAAQQQKLSIVSPVNGVVDRWNLASELASKPVTQGEFLFTVSTGDDWKAELEIPEHESGYVLQQQQQSACSVNMRLRSNSNTEFDAKISQVASVATLSESGLPVVVAEVKLQPSEMQLRSGSTVRADIDCGSRSVGFVWFRSLVEWLNQKGW